MREGERKHRPHARLRGALGLLLGVLALPAFALGLGQIRVKSKPGQPLLAEIPIVTSDPTELQGLQARLASPETFRRIGLEPPEGVVSGLRFEPALDQDGKPVIRVTSAQPVQQAELRFLVEVDWGEGRLVREYSALIDPPRSLAAAAVPQVQAPEAGSAGTIQRPAATAAAQVQPSAEAQAAPAAAQPESRPDAAEAPAAAATSVPAAPAAPTQPPAPATPAGDPAEHAVQAGETLSGIARGFPGTEGYSLNQTMLALLRANPEAFIGQDINRLRAGAVLRTPGREELSRYSAAQANAMVREQVANWRQSRRAQAQPAVAAAGAEGEGRSAARADDPSKRVADARLEIAPPRSSASAQAGTQSGASAGGEGEMLRQELQQTKESLAARDAEVAELKTRVAELEQLQKEQQRLIAMKDDALAGAQQRLAATNAAQQAPAPGAAGEAQAAAGGSIWWWLLPLALVLGGLVWWFRRGRAVPARPAARDSGPGWAGKGRPSAPAARSGTPARKTGSSPAWAPAGSDDAGDSASERPLAGRERIEQARAHAERGDHGTARSLLQEAIDDGDPQVREEATRALQALR